MDVSKLIASMKGLSAGSAVLSKIVERVSDIVRTMEPGDIAGGGLASAVPIADDLWYLFYHQNLMQKYYPESEDFKYKDYSTYLNENLAFLGKLPGLKPLRVYTDLKKQLSVDIMESVFGGVIKANYLSNGIYWINTAFFELRVKDTSLKYPSVGSDGSKLKPSDYVGYIAFPVGQLGTMEVISLLQETDLSGYRVDGVWLKMDLTDLEDKDKPTVQDPPEVFPDMKTDSGQQLAGKNYCYGKQIITSGYYKEDAHVELWADNIKDYGQDIKPKFWMRYWIHKDSTLPVPGEFIGVLVRPVAAPPHVWWFQESAPFLYAGNWMETGNLTSGVVTEITLEDDRTDGGTGNLYKVKVQGCELRITASDFYRYTVGDRVAVLKRGSLAPATTAFSAKDQIYLKESNAYKNVLVINTDYVILPLAYFTKKA